MSWKLRPSSRAIISQAAAVLLVFGLLGALLLWRHWPVDAARPVRINVRWTPETGEVQRRQAETALGLLDPQALERNGWQYTIVDTSSQALSRIVRHPAAEDTHGIDRARATLSNEVQAQRAGLSRSRTARAFDAALEQPGNWVLLVAMAWVIPWVVPRGQDPRFRADAGGA